MFNAKKFHEHFPENSQYPINSDYDQSPMPTGTNTAILIFSRHARAEAEVKSFVPGIGKKVNISIARQFLKQTIVTASKTKIPVLTCYGPAQKGNNFGDRITNAIQDVFEKGYQKVIVLGSDCPNITASQLLFTASQLETCPLIMGPALDGGVYLIGIRRDSFRREEFSHLAWETVKLQATLRRYARQLDTGIHWLEPQQDIDNAEDFKTFFANLYRFSRLKSRLLNILKAPRLKPITISLTLFIAEPALNDSPLRAPPVPF